MDDTAHTLETAPHVAPAKAGRLSKQDWLTAGLTILGQKGAEGVRIDAICKALGVTKGSFYWHFRDREDLMASLFTYWDTRETRGLIDYVEGKFANPNDRLWHVVKEVTLGDYDVTVEVAMRHWAYQEPAIRAQLEEVDAQRLDFFARQFSACGFDTESASLRAHTLYSVTLIRGFMQTREEKDVLENRLRASLDLLLKR